jgi:hypothetical protein
MKTVVMNLCIRLIFRSKEINNWLPLKARTIIAFIWQLHGIHEYFHIFNSSIPNGDESSINKNSEKDATTTDAKDIPDESTRSGKWKRKWFYSFNYYLDGDVDEEDETDEDNPGSDPDFGGKRRTVNTTLVFFSF